MLARTTFTPWQDTEMDEHEYASLKAQGLIYEEPEPPAPEADTADTSDKPRKRPAAEK